MAGEAFPASRRIRKRSEFLRIQRDGRAFRTPHFVLLIQAQAEDAGPSRLGIVATKKLGHSPARNRGKRLCREVFRRSDGFVPAGFDCVVLLRAGAHELTFERVQREWEGVRGAIRRHCEEARKAAEKGSASEVPVESEASRPHVAATQPLPSSGRSGGNTP